MKLNPGVIQAVVARDEEVAALSPNETETMPDFTGKIVIFYLTGTAADTWGAAGVAMGYINPRVVAGRVVLEGRLPQVGGDAWAWGLHAVVAWESVAHYLVFNSLEEYKQRAPVKPGFWQRVKNLVG